MNKVDVDLSSVCLPVWDAVPQRRLPCIMHERPSNAIPPTIYEYGHIIQYSTVLLSSLPHVYPTHCLHMHRIQPYP
jgi:hypothetical protein